MTRRPAATNGSPARHGLGWRAQPTDDGAYIVHSGLQAGYCNRSAPAGLLDRTGRPPAADSPHQVKISNLCP
jgi:hypothetical protein